MEHKEENYKAMSGEKRKDNQGWGVGSMGKNACQAIMRTHVQFLEPR